MIHIHKISHILKDLERHIIESKPFSLIRFGDGGLKFIEAVINDDEDQLEVIVDKEGIPRNKIIEVFELWGLYARQANYIDSPEVYFTNEFWPRLKGPTKQMSQKTLGKLEGWEELYNRAEFDNTSYCNPEVNFLMILKRHREKNLFNILENRKVACITSFPEVTSHLKDFDISPIPIVKQYEGHYENSFKYVIEIIKKKVNKYDLWLVAAGELGRLYSGMIKELGGRAIDIGFVIEYWLHGEVPIRLTPFIRPSSNKLELRLQGESHKYKKFL